MPVSGGGQPSRTITLDEFEVTGAPPVSVTVAVAVSMILPAVMFLAVMVRVPVQVSLVMPAWRAASPARGRGRGKREPVMPPGGWSRRADRQPF
jgi:hypothetical protein